MSSNAMTAYYEGRADHFRRLALRAPDPREADLYEELTREFAEKAVNASGAIPREGLALPAL